MSDLFTRLERAYTLGVDLDTSVAHLVDALSAIQAGRFEDAHWALSRGGFATEPKEHEIEFAAVHELPVRVKKKRKGRAA